MRDLFGNPRTVDEAIDDVPALWSGVVDAGQLDMSQPFERVWNRLEWLLQHTNYSLNELVNATRGTDVVQQQIRREQSWAFRL